MSWFEILKRMTKLAETLLIDIMSDGEKRTVEEILDEMWNKVEQHIGRIKTGKYTIPTKHEIRHFLGKSENYESAIFDTITGKQQQRKNLLRHYHKRYYWRV